MGTLNIVRQDSWEPFPEIPDASFYLDYGTLYYKLTSQTSINLSTFKEEHTHRKPHIKPVEVSIVVTGVSDTIYKDYSLDRARGIKLKVVTPTTVELNNLDTLPIGSCAISTGQRNPFIKFSTLNGKSVWLRLDTGEPLEFLNFANDANITIKVK